MRLFWSGTRKVICLGKEVSRSVINTLFCVLPAEISAIQRFKLGAVCKRYGANVATNKVFAARIAGC
jgi:hypothetical protein